MCITLEMACLTRLCCQFVIHKQLLVSRAIKLFDDSLCRLTRDVVYSFCDIMISIPYNTRLLTFTYCVRVTIKGDIDKWQVLWRTLYIRCSLKISPFCKRRVRVFENHLCVIRVTIKIHLRFLRLASDHVFAITIFAADNVQTNRCQCVQVDG